MPNIAKNWYTWIFSAGVTFHFLSSFLDVDSLRWLEKKSFKTFLKELKWETTWSYIRSYFWPWWPLSVIRTARNTRPRNLEATLILRRVTEVTILLPVLPIMAVDTCLNTAAVTSLLHMVVDMATQNLCLTVTTQVIFS